MLTLLRGREPGAPRLQVFDSLSQQGFRDLSDEFLQHAVLGNLGRIHPDVQSLILIHIEKDALRAIRLVGPGMPHWQGGSGRVRIPCAGKPCRILHHGRGKRLPARLVRLGEYPAMKDDKELIISEEEWYLQGVERTELESPRIRQLAFPCVVEGAPQELIGIHSRLIRLRSDRPGRLIHTHCLKDIAAVGRDDLVQIVPSRESGIHEHKGEIREAFISGKRAIEMDPNDSDVQIMMAFLYILIGKIDKAKPLAKRAIEIDPLFPLAYTGEWWVYLTEGKYDKMLEVCLIMYNLNKENLLSILAYGQALVYNNKKEEATRLFDLTFKKYPNETWSLMGKALRHAINNEKQKALKFITRKVEKAAELDHVVAWWLAQIYALVDEKNMAIDYLERATRENINYPLFSKYDPLLENIRGEERFKKLMEKVKYKWEHFEI